MPTHKSNDYIFYAVKSAFEMLKGVMRKSANIQYYR